MNAYAIGLSLLVTSAAIVFITRPWRVRPESDSHARSRPVDQALAERREGIILALRDLDFDHSLGKVAEEDYAPLRQALLAEAAGVMAQQDEGQAGADAGLDERIEAEVLAARQSLRAGQGEKSCPTCGRRSRPGDAFCATCGARLAASCAVCGRPARSADLFCAACGAELALAPS